MAMYGTYGHAGIMVMMKMNRPPKKVLGEKPLFDVMPHHFIRSWPSQWRFAEMAKSILNPYIFLADHFPIRRGKAVVINR